MFYKYCLGNYRFLNLTEKEILLYSVILLIRPIKMTLKKYFNKTKKFFSNLFNYKEKKRNLSKQLLKYEKELINLYNNLMFSLERFYWSFDNQTPHFVPITSLNTDYSRLFNKNIRDEFDIYETKRGLTLQRKGLENYI